MASRIGADLGERGRSLLAAWPGLRTPDDVLLGHLAVLRLAAEMTDPSLDEAIALIGSHLGRLHDLREQSIARLLAEISRFCAFAALQGVTSLGVVTPEDCADFVGQAIQNRAGGWLEPSVSTRYLRRTALRLLFRSARELALASGDPTLDLVLPPRSARSTRPLGDDEEALGRVWSQPTLTGTRHTAAWALGQATATGTEQASITVGDLDMANARVWLSGNDAKRDARWGSLTDWGMVQIDRRLAVVGSDPDAPVITAAARSRNARQASACNAIAEILVHAGLRTDPGIKPGSLPAWAGLQVFRSTGRIDDTAHALGVRSLDRTAEIIGWDW